MKDDSKGVAMARPQPTHAVPHVDAIRAPCTRNRPMMDREDHALALAKGNDLGSRLHARPLLGEYKFAAREIDSRLRKQECDLEREDVLAIDIPRGRSRGVPSRPGCGRVLPCRMTP